MTEPKEDWEEEFDNNIKCQWVDGKCVYDEDDVKSFIRSLVKPKVDREGLNNIIKKWGKDGKTYFLADAIIEYLEKEGE